MKLLQIRKINGTKFGISEISLDQGNQWCQIWNQFNRHSEDKEIAVQLNRSEEAGGVDQLT